MTGDEHVRLLPFRRQLRREPAPRPVSSDRVAPDDTGAQRARSAKAPDHSARGTHDDSGSEAFDISEWEDEGGAVNPALDDTAVDDDAPDDAALDDEP
jgi:hypothetical protein